MSEPDVDDPPEPEEPDTSAKAVVIVPIVGAATALAVGVTGLATTGTIGRTQRNYPGLFTLALALAAVAACCFVMAAIVANKKQWSEGSTWERFFYFWEWTAKPWRILGVGAAFVGVVIGFWAAIHTVGEAERPTVAVRLDQRTLAVVGSVKASHLASSDPLNVSIDGLKTMNGVTRATRIWERSVGSDSDGNVTVAVRAQVPPGRYTALSVQAKISDSAPDSCATRTTTPAADGGPGGAAPAASQPAIAPEATSEGAGCQVIALPAIRQRPRVTTAWKGKHRRRLRVTVRVANRRGERATDPMLHLEVVGRVPQRRRTMLYRAVMVPGPTGAVQRRAWVRVRPKVTLVCVRAHFVARETAVELPHCPLSHPGGMPSVELRR